MEPQDVRKKTKKPVKKQYLILSILSPVRAIVAPGNHESRSKKRADHVTGSFIAG
jgi:hypothetical protein